MLTDERVDIVELQVYDCILNLRGIHVLDVHRHLAASQLLAQLGCIFQRLDGAVGVNATLEAERGIRRQTVTARRLANPGGMEIGRLQHHVLRGLIRTAALAAEDTGDTHGLLGIADGQVAVAQLMLYAVQRLEGSALRHRFHHNLVALHHVGIEAMQGLPQGHHHVVGDVHDVVDGTQTYRGQLRFQPLRRLLHLAARDADAGVALAGLLVLDDDIDGKVVIVDREAVGHRFVQGGLITVLAEPGIQVAGHAPMAQGVGAVSRDVHLDEPVALQMIILSSGCSHHCIVGQYDDAVVR